MLHKIGRQCSRNLEIGVKPEFEHRAKVFICHRHQREAQGSQKPYGWAKDITKTIHCCSRQSQCRLRRSKGQVQPPEKVHQYERDIQSTTG